MDDSVLSGDLRPPLKVEESPMDSYEIPDELNKLLFCGCAEIVSDCAGFTLRCPFPLLVLLLPLVPLAPKPTGWMLEVDLLRAIFPSTAAPQIGDLVAEMSDSFSMKRRFPGDGDRYKRTMRI